VSERDPSRARRQRRPWLEYRLGEWRGKERAWGQCYAGRAFANCERVARKKSGIVANDREAGMLKIDLLVRHGSHALVWLNCMQEVAAVKASKPPTQILWPLLYGTLDGAIRLTVDEGPPISLDTPWRLS
jgi:hypothetical protein